MEKDEERLILTSDRDFEEQMNKREYLSHDNSEDDSLTNAKSANTSKKKNSKEQKPWQVVLEYVRVIAIGALIAFLLSKFVIINAVIPSRSMSPTISVGDRLIGLRLSYYWGSPERGDVAIFVTPDPSAAEGELYIKRVIGLPGETVTIDGTQVTITHTDGSVEILQEDYIVYPDTQVDASYNHQSVYLHYEGELDADGNLAVDENGDPYENQYFMMGDNRGDSKDSRYWGTVNEDAILAKALFRYWKGFATIQ